MTRKQFFRKVSFWVLILHMSLALAASAAPAEPPQALLTVAHPNVQAIIAVQNAVTPSLMANPVVLGTAVGLDGQGQPALLILLNSEAKNAAGLAPGLLASVRGVNVAIELTEPFHAPIRVQPMDTSGALHRVKQTPPIQLGTSGGWRYDLANGYCCSGTLGSLVQVGTNQYILSNYHVFWGDSVPGGNGIVATAGDPVIQPGLVDISCNANNAQIAANLSSYGSLSAANVDAGIAQVASGMVRTDGSIIDIGTISKTTVAASLGQAVKKSGRTSGLTTSSVNGLNATVSVTYDNECAGGTAFTKTFTGQILVKNKNRNMSFLVSGDSGSLMVENVGTNPRAVGLLYAGSSTTAVANPIGQVLSWISSIPGIGGTATMVGQ
jgi:hypothetical protein